MVGLKYYGGARKPPSEGHRDSQDLRCKLDSVPTQEAGTKKIPLGGVGETKRAVT